MFLFFNFFFFLIFNFFIFFILFFFFFFECLGIQFFSSVKCDLQDTMPYQRSLTLLRREAEEFPRGGNHPKHMPPLTYLAWFQPIYYNSSFAFIHINIAKVFTCGENFNKEYYFLPGSVFFYFILFFQVQFSKILIFFRFSFELISQQPWKHKAAATLINNHKP